MSLEIHLRIVTETPSFDSYGAAVAAGADAPAATRSTGRDRSTPPAAFSLSGVSARRSHRSDGVGFADLDSADRTDRADRAAGGAASDEPERFETFGVVGLAPREA